MSIVSDVNNLVLACLNGKEEGALVIDGIVTTFGFSSEAIAANRSEIKALLDKMPIQFHKNGGGGWSFLNLCMDRNGDQWGEHTHMEALCCLGIAAGFAHWMMPREMWPMLPGGVPYVGFDTEEAKQEVNA